MKTDEAIQEIRATRQKISAEHEHDTRKLLAHYLELDKKYAKRVLRSAQPSTGNTAA